MDDRTLLERAARAAGIDGEYGVLSKQIHVRDAGGYSYWNPRDDDGDALRLAITLRLKVLCNPSNVEVVATGTCRAIESYADHALDTCAATRRAIVRAAAALAGD